MVLHPVPQRNVRAVGQECRGKKLVLDSGKFQRAVLYGRLALVSGNSQLFVLQQIQFAAGFVIHGDELRRVVHGLVAESAAPGHRDGLRLAVQRYGDIHRRFVIKIEFQFLLDVQMPVAPVHIHFNGRV